MQFILLIVATKLKLNFIIQQNFKFIVEDPNFMPSNLKAVILIISLTLGMNVFFRKVQLFVQKVSHYAT